MALKTIGAMSRKMMARLDSMKMVPRVYKEKVRLV
jgi:hypothetical protein